MTTIRRILFLVLLCLCISAPFTRVIAQEIETEIKQVTVYLEGAEIEREKTIDLKKGENEITFEGLSSEMDPQSVRLSSPGLTLLSISHAYNFLNAEELRSDLDKLNQKQTELRREIDLLKAERSAIQQEKEVLLANKQLGGSQGLTAGSLRESMNYFREALGELEKGLLQKNFEIAEKQSLSQQYGRQINEISKGEVQVRTQVRVVLDAPRAGAYPIRLNYLVGECGWIPSYDIMAQRVDSPLQIRYHASVYQKTGIDWEQTQLIISSGNPYQNSILPELKPWRIGQQTRRTPPINRTATAYKPTFDRRVKGRILDQNGYPLEGVIIQLTGTTIGTITDANGEYEVPMPEANSRIMARKSGYTDQVVAANPSFTTTRMQPRQDVVRTQSVIRDRIQNTPASIDMLSGNTTGILKKPSLSIGLFKDKGPRKTTNLIPLEKMAYQTNFSYKLDLPYSINSDGKPRKITMVEEQIEVPFEYNTVPKLDEKAYLTTYLTDWGKYNFLSGQARLFFEGQYIGNTVLDTRFVNDTLRLSLGRDNSILVQRQKITDFEQRKFFGSKIRDSRTFEITLLNNKESSISIRVRDQVPLSPSDNIKVSLQEAGNAFYLEETGELSWNITLKPGEKKKLRFAYEVEYPKSLRIGGQLE